ncbi:MAG: class I SAM-dependent methyltransferase [Coprococcus sp.]
MNQIEELLRSVLTSMLVDIIISGARGSSGFTKIKVRPVKIKGIIYFQAAKYTDKQVFHENLTADEALDLIGRWLVSDFRQAQIRMQDRNISVLVSKKGKVTVKTKSLPNSRSQNLEHNRTKRYILEEGIAVPFLVDLGVMTDSGKIVRTKYDKYRQINRFLEFIEDILPELPKGRTLRIIDFGCGKSYLTFAMYYYLKELKGYDLNVTGLDLKETVIAECQALADRYGYDGLHFLCGDIADFEGEDSVDMVVTLHACDTATDYALYKAVRWKAGVILSVPCCQHELNRKMKCDTLAGAFQYGLIQERTAALMTDAMRGQLLEIKGYRTQLLEFIDMEHTPKNILIRAVRSQKMMLPAVRKQRIQQYETCREFFGTALTLERLLNGTEAEL